jgi:septum formation protein
MEIILASASPRRRELMGHIAERFEVVPADIDETPPEGIKAEEAAEYLAVRKAAHIAKTRPVKAGELIIGCDTAVIIDGEMLGKPSDAEEARRMLRRLSGRTHRVITGVCLFALGGSGSFSETTEVTFYPLTDNEIEGYIETGDPFDKAGGYGIQEKGSFLVRGIIGDFYNVMGLPAARLKREIERMATAVECDADRAGYRRRG